jgi:hypothetical protein
LACEIDSPLRFTLLVLYKSYKTLVKTLDNLTDLLKDFELKTAKDSTLITKTSERLNSFYVLKYNTELLNHFLAKIPLKAKDIWVCTSVLQEFSIVAKDLLTVRA